jgi:hypothetical protein
MSATRWGLLGLLLLPASLALAQEQSSSAIPRTQDGRPDFHGVWATDLLPLTFQRVRGATKLVVGDVEAQALSANLFGAFTGGTVTDPGDLLAMGRSLPSVNGEWRTSMIISPDDGKSPLTAEGQRLNAQEAARAMAIPDGHEQRPWGERCLGSTGRAPFGIYPTANLREVVQTHDHLLIYSDDTGEVRIVGIGAKPRPSAIVSFNGDSVAYWKGDVLVVETKGLRGEQSGREILPGLVVRDGSKVIERFSLLRADELLYQFTVEDPGVYSGPWSAEYSMRRQDVTTYESGCHEGNYSVPNILKAARENDRLPIVPASPAPAPIP